MVVNLCVCGIKSNYLDLMSLQRYWRRVRSSRTSRRIECRTIIMKLAGVSATSVATFTSREELKFRNSDLSVMKLNQDTLQTTVVAATLCGGCCAPRTIAISRCQYQMLQQDARKSSRRRRGRSPLTALFRRHICSIERTQDAVPRPVL